MTALCGGIEEDVAGLGVDYEPDGRDVGSAVGPDRGELGGAGAVAEEGFDFIG